MGILFISHSSQNNSPAVKVRDWLREQGWHEVFLDLDPEQGLAPGQRWQEELKKAGERCSAVVVLISPEWVASRWCVTEFLLASQLGKRIFPVLIAPTHISDLPIELTAHFQIADMSSSNKEADGLNRLRIGLKRAGLDPQDFIWPPPGEPNRSPYRGLRTLHEVDAGIFFGRDAQITRALDALRRMRDGTPERILMILGASGAGKSSFLRAGLLARLNRDEEQFLVLPVVRPERAALSGPNGLARALGLASAGPLTREMIITAFEAIRTPTIDRLARYARAGQHNLIAQPPTLILPIDQGEELFTADQGEGAAACEALAESVTVDNNILVIMTIRSDSFVALQTNAILSAIPRLPFDLPPISLASFKDVIEGPGRLCNPKLLIEEELVAQLVVDLDQADALPLLAFTLERLATDFGRGGVLRLIDYHDGLGGLNGAIERAVSEAFVATRKDYRMPDDLAALESLARSAFIPWLLRLDGADQGPKRRVALQRELPTSVHALVQHFVDQRLLISDRRQDGEVTVEVSHEGILRHWALLRRWIGEERETLAQAEAVIRAAADWRDDVAKRGTSPALLLHRGARLASAATLLERDDIAQLIGANGQAYLAACRIAEREELKSRRLQQRSMFAGIGVALVMALTLSTTLWKTGPNLFWAQKRELERGNWLLGTERLVHSVFRIKDDSNLYTVGDLGVSFFKIDESTAEPAEFKGKASDYVISPVGTHVLLRDEDGRVSELQLVGAHLQSVAVPDSVTQIDSVRWPPSTSRPHLFGFSEDGLWRWAVSPNGHLVVWSIGDTNAELKVWDFEIDRSAMLRSENLSVEQPILRFLSSTNAFCWSVSDYYLFVSLGDSHVKTREVAGRTASSILGDAIAVSRDRVAVVSSEGKLDILSPAWSEPRRVEIPGWDAQQRSSFAYKRIWLHSLPPDEWLLQVGDNIYAVNSDRRAAAEIWRGQNGDNTRPFAVLFPVDDSRRIIIFRRLSCRQHPRSRPVA